MERSIVKAVKASMRHLSKVALIIIKVLLFAALLMNVVTIIVLIRNRAAGIDFPLSESNAYLMAEPLLRIIFSTWLFLVLMAVSTLCRLGKKWAVFSGSILSLIASGIAGLVALAGAKVSAFTAAAYYMAVAYAALSIGAALFAYLSIRLLAPDNPLRNNDANGAMMKLFWLPLVVVLIFTGVWSQDEALDQEFNRFYANNHKEVLDKDNVAVGLAGLDAPLGSNFMDVGRAEFQVALQNTHPNQSETPAIPKTKAKIAFESPRVSWRLFGLS